MLRILVCPGVGSGSLCSVPEALVMEVADLSVTGEAFATNPTVVVFTENRFGKRNKKKGKN